MSACFFHVAKVPERPPAAAAISVEPPPVRRPLSRDERRELVALLRAQGLSIRAIATAVGAATNTVLSDLARECDADR
jgi:transposase-like protein